MDAAFPARWQNTLMEPKNIENQKNVEYYAATVNAWFNTSLEHDKSLLTLSAGGIGLLLTLLTTVGLSSAEALILYIGAIASFVVALVVILAVFRRNRTYIEGIVSGKSKGDDPLLSKLDFIALCAFGTGVMFTAIIGIAAAVHSYSTKEITMATETTKNSETVPLHESFNGVSILQTPADLTKSFNGATNLQPPPAASTLAPAASTAAPAAPAASATPASTDSSQKQSGNGK